VKLTRRPTSCFRSALQPPTIKVRDLGVALEWQGKMRQVFRAYFKKGYVASDFWVGEEEGHLRAFYYLEKDAGKRR